MDLERFEKHVAQACALIASLREENRRLRRETSGLRLRNGTLENAGKTTQAKVIELLQACDRIS